MNQLEQLIDDSISVAESRPAFDQTTLKAVYSIVRKAMNGRTTVGHMEADDLVQVILLIILTNRRCGREKLAHWGLIKKIAVNFVRREGLRANGRPSHEPLPDALPARRQPDRLLVGEFLEQAALFLNDSQLELLTLCLKKGYRLDLRDDRKDAARSLGITRCHLRHMLDKLRFQHGQLWREYLSLF